MALEVILTDFCGLNDFLFVIGLAVINHNYRHNACRGSSLIVICTLLKIKIAGVFRLLIIFKRFAVGLCLHSLRSWVPQHVYKEFSKMFGIKVAEFTDRL